VTRDSTNVKSNLKRNAGKSEAFKGSGTRDKKVNAAWMGPKVDKRTCAQSYQQN